VLVIVYYLCVYVCLYLISVSVQIPPIQRTPEVRLSTLLFLLFRLSCKAQHILLCIYKPMWIQYVVVDRLRTPANSIEQHSSWFGNSRSVGPLRFIAVFTITCYDIRLWTRWIQATPSLLILFFEMYLNISLPVLCSLIYFPLTMLLCNICVSRLS
jgi:hypothetical protein